MMLEPALVRPACRRTSQLLIEMWEGRQPGLLAPQEKRFGNKYDTHHNRIVRDGSIRTRFFSSVRQCVKARSSEAHIVGSTVVFCVLTR